MEGRGERGSEWRNVEMEGQGETVSEGRSRSRNSACRSRSDSRCLLPSNDHHCEEIRSKREDIVADGALPIAPENQRTIEQAAEIANDNEVQEIQEPVDQQSSGPTAALPLVPDNLLAIEIVNEKTVEISRDNGTDDVLEEPADQPTNNDNDETDNDDDDETDSYVDDVDWRIETRNVDDEVAEILGTEFPHLIAEQSTERQYTEELLRRQVERTRELHAAQQACWEIRNALIDMAESRRRSLGRDIGSRNRVGNLLALIVEGRELADDELLVRYQDANRRTRALGELWAESNREVNALIERGRNERRRFERLRREGALRTMSISEHHINNNNTITSCCSICQFDFELGEEASQVQCGHLYHRPCISEWLDCNNTCPVCRFQM